MKPLARLLFIIIFQITAFVVTAQQQQLRPSQRSFSAEIQKINTIKAQRNLFISSSNLYSTNLQSAPFNPSLNPWVMKMNSAKNNLLLNNFRNASVYLSDDKKASGKEMKLPNAALIRRSFLRPGN